MTGWHHNAPLSRPLAHMRFDLSYELAVPPQAGLSEARAYAETLAQLELADHLGYRCAWLLEHHFLRGYSHCSKPELVLAAAASCTATSGAGAVEGSVARESPELLAHQVMPAFRHKSRASVGDSTRPLMN